MMLRCVPEREGTCEPVTRALVASGAAAAATAAIEDEDDLIDEIVDEIDYVRDVQSFVYDTVEDRVYGKPARGFVSAYPDPLDVAEDELGYLPFYTEVPIPLPPIIY